MLSVLFSNPPLVAAIAASLVVVAAACKMWMAAEEYEHITCTLGTCAAIIFITALIAGCMAVDEFAGHGREYIQLSIASLMAFCAAVASLWALVYALLRPEPPQWGYGTAVLTLATSANCAGVRSFLAEGSTQRLLAWMFGIGWIIAVVVAIIWLEVTVKKREASA